VKLKNQFKDSPEFEKILRTVLSWDVRYDRIKRIILKADPDIMTFQEMDHLKQFIEDEQFKAKYTCLVDKTARYRPAKYASDSDSGDLRPENYLRHILTSRAAFAPKSYSKASSLQKKRQDDSDDIDDDGVAIFWKKVK
jgi:mRNA deadenylase 3'-5' endonuclease subunit Ccr4